MEHKYPVLQEGNTWTKTEKMIWDMYYFQQTTIRVYKVLIVLSLILNVVQASLRHG